MRSTQTMPRGRVAPALTFLALLGAPQPSDAGLVDAAWCVATQCVFQFFQGAECGRCVESHVDFGRQLAPSYVADTLATMFPGRAYTESWCGAEHLGTGGWDWDATAKNYTGCEVKDDFPGQGTTSVQAWEQVVTELKTVPGRFARGEIWRGNELGYVIANEQYWPHEISPRGSLLQATPAQHAVLRPYLEKWFTCDAVCAAGLLESARAFQSDENVPERMNIQADVKKWVFQENFKRVFPGAANPIPMDEFVDSQKKLATFMTASQFVPVVDLVTAKARAQLRRHFEAIRGLVATYYGPELPGDDVCAPSASCVDQLASAVMDAFYLAGGLSVPSAISTGLWVLYADTSQYGDTFPHDHRMDRQDPRAFFYESMRFFAPVNGFPWWEVPPARATDEAASQYRGGTHRVMNLLLAQRDPNVWGADGHKFRVRPLSEYHTWFVGFADHAVDPAHPQQAKACPGKTLALAMGNAWFTAWEQYAWGPPLGVKLGAKFHREVRLSFVDEFELVRRSSQMLQSYVWATVVSSVVSQTGHWITDLHMQVDTYAKLFSILVRHERAVIWPDPTPDAAFLRKPYHEGAVATVRCGLAHLEVPVFDETWAEWTNFYGEDWGLIRAIRDVVEGGVQPAAASGSWAGVGDPQGALEAQMADPIDKSPVLVEWDAERKYTDAGFEDFVFRGIGQHRLERVRGGDAHARNARTNEVAAYAVYLGFMNAFEVRAGFERAGADAYFTRHGRVSHIRYNGRTWYPSRKPGRPGYNTHHLGAADCRGVHAHWGGFFFRKCLVDAAWCADREGVFTGRFFGLGAWGSCEVPTERDWQHVKTVFLGSLSAIITVHDHLYIVHLTHASQVAHASLVALPAAHPIRRFTAPHTFHTNAINYKASYALINENEMVHRGGPFTKQGLADVFNALAEHGEGDAWSLPTEKYAAQGIQTPVSLPLHEDGAEYQRIVQRYVDRSLREVYNVDADDCGADPALQGWWAHIARAGNTDNFPEALTCAALAKVLTVFIFSGTAMHVHAGSLYAEVLDPCHAPWAVPVGMRAHTVNGTRTCGAPRTAGVQVLTFILTGLEQPVLMDDYTHLFEHEGQKEAWRLFQDELAAFKTVIDARNAARPRPFLTFDPAMMDAGVGI